MPECGTQVILCDFPVRFDNYSGCTHGCRYCFVTKKKSISRVKKLEGLAALKKFIDGNRTIETKWCDWDIPLHWGGVSDPFQPAEEQHRLSCACLKIFADTGYPFIVSTKGRLVADERYLDLLSQCNCVVQVSMVSADYDRLEPGAPPFVERLEMLKKLAPRVKRLIVRIQPYMRSQRDNVLNVIPQYGEIGVHGIIVEGLKLLKKRAGFTNVGGDFCYPLAALKRDFQEIKGAAHKHGLKFYSGENRLRSMGDSVSCCGADNMKGFRPHTYNLNHLKLKGGAEAKATPRMQEVGTALCFMASFQKTIYTRMLPKYTFKQVADLRMRENMDVVG